MSLLVRGTFITATRRGACCGRQSMIMDLYDGWLVVMLREDWID